ncbi:MAG: decarboxylase [Candidatus Zixiibacteriota bacterium]
MSKSSEDYSHRIAALLKQPIPRLERSELEAYVRGFIGRRDSFLQLVRGHGSPLYALDKEALISRAREFRAVFRSRFPSVTPFYAVKSNNCPEIARLLVADGYGLDVSSGEELQLALDSGASAIIFSGPGKSDTELALAVNNADRVTIMLDSFGELQRLERVAGGLGRVVRTGVRVSTAESGIWRKFGTPLETLGEFFEQAVRCRFVQLKGIQFHISWNMNPSNQVLFVMRLGQAIKSLTAQQQDAIEFLDIGGGYWPPRGEWLQPAATPEGIIGSAIGERAGSPLDHRVSRASPLDDFARSVAQAVDDHMPAGKNITLYFEPGRWVCHEAMHILVKVVDRKAADLVITDAGTNAVGWERYESDYFPVINLTRPSLEERECLVAGSLCTPHDLWGYTYFGDDIQPEDVLLIPDQGAYTYSLRQHFIKPLPPVVVMTGPGRPVSNQGSR